MDVKKNSSKEQGGGINIGAKTFIGTVALLVGIMVLAGALTYIVPRGHFEYSESGGHRVVLPGTYKVAVDEPPLPVWRWFTAPVEVLGTEKALTAGVIMVFILLVGGSFLVMEQSGMLSTLIYSIIRRFEGKKYRLMAIITLVCMLMGSTMGLFEETITLVPITVALSLMLGWDSLVGIGISILAVGFGFSAGTINPFTIGIAQKLADVPQFSGLMLRMAFFACTYLLLLVFLMRYAKRIENNPMLSPVYKEDEAARRRYRLEDAGAAADDPARRKAIKLFLVCLAVVFIYIIVAFFIPLLSDYSLPVMAVGFTVGALVAGHIAGLKKGLFTTFLKGVGSIAPSVLLILLALSITHIMETGNIIDSILNGCYGAVQGLGPYGGALALFALVLLMNFFVGGASAKAFLLIPIIIPLSDMIGITRQTAIQAFALGDGFADMIYPTSVVLLITLGIVGVPYSKWFRWTWKLQALLVAVCVAAMLVAVAINYA